MCSVRRILLAASQPASQQPASPSARSQQPAASSQPVSSQPATSQPAGQLMVRPKTAIADHRQARKPHKGFSRFRTRSIELQYCQGVLMLLLDNGRPCETILAHTIFANYGKICSCCLKSIQHEGSTGDMGLYLVLYRGYAKKSDLGSAGVWGPIFLLSSKS